MSREIKFRAWLTNGKGLTFVKDGFMEDNVTVIDGKYADVESGWDIHGTYDFPLMQYTGLLDRNGVEIYEGDIVKWVSARGEAIISRVEYAPDVAAYLLMPHIHDFYSNDREVIGNIYENPELLESK